MIKQWMHVDQSFKRTIKIVPNIYNVITVIIL